MRLTFKHFDARRFSFEDITDQDTGEQVGHINAYGSQIGGGGGISISLFGDKYLGHVNTYQECVGFVKGVESVLNHLVDTRSPPVSVTGTRAA